MPLQRVDTDLEPEGEERFVTSSSARQGNYEERIVTSSSARQPERSTSSSSHVRNPDAQESPHTGMNRENEELTDAARATNEEQGSEPAADYEVRMRKDLHEPSLETRRRHEAS